MAEDPARTAEAARTALAAPNADTPGAALEVLARLWREVLETDRAVVAADDFFSLGGHSLQAVQLTFAVFDNFGVEVRLHEFLADPTLAGMSRLIAQRVDELAGSGFDEGADGFPELPPDQLHGLFDGA